ncbi:MAG: hypothetical protein ORN57_04755, partial [Alphaproteobacteria bacterium]|nr:hypothetical protein [Alphaproteobacteria bacterium]
SLVACLGAVAPSLLFGLVMWLSLFLLLSVIFVRYHRLPLPVIVADTVARTITASPQNRRGHDNNQDFSICFYDEEDARKPASEQQR